MYKNAIKSFLNLLSNQDQSTPLVNVVPQETKGEQSSLSFWLGIDEGTEKQLMELSIGEAKEVLENLLADNP